MPGRRCAEALSTLLPASSDAYDWSTARMLQLAVPAAARSSRLRQLKRMCASRSHEEARVGGETM